MTKTSKNTVNQDESLDQQLQSFKQTLSVDTQALEARIIASAARAATESSKITARPLKQNNISLFRYRVAIPVFACLLLAGVILSLPIMSEQPSARELALAEIEYEELWLMEEQLNFDDVFWEPLQKSG